MGKIIFAASLLLGMFVSQLVYAQCNTGIGRTEGSSNTTTSTSCSNPGNMGAYNGNQGGGGGSGYGPDYRPPEYYTQMEINRQNCRTQIKTAVGDDCKNKRTAILRDSLSSCNTGIAVGSVAAAAGTAGLAALVFFTAPVSLPVLVIGVTAFSSLSLGGTYVAIDSANQCKDTANWNDVDNEEICENTVQKAQSLACNF